MTKEDAMVKTGDGSPTILSTRFNQHYHSIHGAVQESQHVFMKHGLLELDQRQDLNVLELGFGTGMNAFLTLAYRQDCGFRTSYCSYEAFPLISDQYKDLDYSSFIQPEKKQSVFQSMHKAPWEELTEIIPGFSLKKVNADVLNGLAVQNVDLVIFDAFSPNSQPELWTEDAFKMFYNSMKKGGILSTYCAKGDVRRTLISVGFQVNKLPGPPGKREMLQAIKA